MSNNFVVFPKNQEDMSSNGTKAFDNSETAENRFMNYQEMSQGKYMDLTNNSQMETIINQNE